MYESALTAFDNAIRIAPDYKEAVYNRGVCLEAMGDSGGALEAYDQALRIDPDYAPAIANRYKLLADNPGLGTLMPTPVTTPAVNATAPPAEFGVIYGIAGAIVIVSLALLSLVILYITRYGKRHDQTTPGKQAGGKRIRTRTIAQTDHDSGAGTSRTKTSEVVDITKIRTTLLEDTDIDPFVLEAAIAVAIELSREGREGKPIGTAFVIGDNAEVLTKSRQLILNPLEGHPREERLIVRPDLREYIKEMALLDGAFVISGDGVIEAAGRYITVDTSNVTIPQGLGTRHASIAAITEVTRAVGIVVSESGGTITFFKKGEIVGTIR
jgi:DNA integrity scanning protein DisA with diadenylate cyclase activity